MALASSLIIGRCQVEQPQGCCRVDSDFEQLNSKPASGRHFTLGLRCPWAEPNEHSKSPASEDCSPSSPSLPMAHTFSAFRRCFSSTPCSAKRQPHAQAQALQGLSERGTVRSLWDECQAGLAPKSPVTKVLALVESTVPKGPSLGLFTTWGPHRNLAAANGTGRILLTCGTNTG